MEDLEIHLAYEEKERRRASEIAELTRFIEESNAIEGVHGNQAVMDSKDAWYWLTATHRKNLTIPSILKAHGAIMRNQDLEPHFKGVLRNVDVTVGGRECMHWPFIKENLLRWVRQANKLNRPLEDHVAFEKIHPFADGNGRIGRMLMNWQYFKRGEPLRVFTAENRQDYYRMFR